MQRLRGSLVLVLATVTGCALGGQSGDDGTYEPPSLLDDDVVGDDIAEPEPLGDDDAPAGDDDVSVEPDAGLVDAGSAGDVGSGRSPEPDVAVLEPAADASVDAGTDVALGAREDAASPSGPTPAASDGSASVDGGSHPDARP